MNKPKTAERTVAAGIRDQPDAETIGALTKVSARLTWGVNDFGGSLAPFGQVEIRVNAGRPVARGRTPGSEEPVNLGESFTIPATPGSETGAGRESMCRFRRRPGFFLEIFIVHLAPRSAAKGGGQG
ncbi:hypothetical protein [Microbispora sp. NBC_01389]|uniref:hypothetical protein n=1 Tax=Microbispora sp. NBC_01389 TaxID=2903584 RepID=UPI003255A2A3